MKIYFKVVSRPLIVSITEPVTHEVEQTVERHKITTFYSILCGAVELERVLFPALTCSSTKIRKLVPPNGSSTGWYTRSALGRTYWTVAPHICNSPPTEVHPVILFHSFRWQLKNHLFCQLFGCRWGGFY